MTASSLKYQLLFLVTLISATAIENIDANSTIAKREFGETALLPIKMIKGFISFEFLSSQSSSRVDEPRQPVKMMLRSICHSSMYFDVPSPNTPLQALNLNLVANTIGEPHNLAFGGLVGPKVRQENIDESITGEFCIKSPYIPHDPFTNLMFKYPNKIFSLWFGKVDVADTATIGEFSVGSINEKRIAEGPRIRFPLIRLNYQPNNMPPSLITKNPVELRVNDRLRPEACRLVFSYESPYVILPREAYNEIVQQLQNVKKEALVDSRPDFPLDLLNVIHDYGTAKMMRRFDCADASKIPDLKFGEWKIESKTLYSAKQGKCMLLVKPVDLREGKLCTFMVGNQVLRNVHFSVESNSIYHHFAIVSPRKSAAFRRPKDSANSGADCLIKLQNRMKGCTIS